MYLEIPGQYRPAKCYVVKRWKELDPLKFWHLWKWHHIPENSNHILLTLWCWAHNMASSVWLHPWSCVTDIFHAVWTYSNLLEYTGCHRRNGPNFGTVFLMLNYTDITQNTYIQSWMVTEIMAREVWNFDSCYTLTDCRIHIETGRNMWFL